MAFEANQVLTDFLLSQPESGMGYQILSPSIKGFKVEDLVIIINSSIVIELGSEYSNQEVYETKDAACEKLTSYQVINLNSLQGYFNGLQRERNSGAIKNSLKQSTGSDIERFIRLSAFDDDLRIDKVNKCLLPGSYVTTLEDFLTMGIKSFGIINDPGLRYALPSNLPIEWVFYIHPKSGDQYRKGKVEPAFNRPGGGVECFFEFGTSKDTLTSITAFKSIV